MIEEVNEIGFQMFLYTMTQRTNKWKSEAIEYGEYGGWGRAVYPSEIIVSRVTLVGGRLLSLN